jgi:hypothetical protein
MSKQEVQKGLRLLPEDGRDFQLGAIFLLPDLKDLPESFVFKRPTIKDQGDTDYCTAFVSSIQAEMQDGVVLSPLYAFAASKKISGDPNMWGQNIRDSQKVWTKYGGVPEKLAKYKVNKDLFNGDVRFLDKWDDLKDIRDVHMKESYFKVKGQHDTFDDIRASIWKFREVKRAVSIGVLWEWRLGEKFLTKETAIGGQYGHCLAVIGWETIDDETYLVVHNSYGTRAGENGLHYISRDVINKNIDKYGAFMMVDISKEDAQYKLDRGIKEGDNWLVQLVKILVATIKSISARW